MHKGELANINPPRITTEPIIVGQVTLYFPAALEEKTLIILLVISVL